MEDISNILKNKAISKGLCDTWTKGWGKGHTLESLIAKYKSGLQWSMENKFPDIKFIDDNFGDLARIKNIYTKDKHTVYNSSISVCRGISEVEIYFNYYSLGSVWIGDNSNVNITVIDASIVTIHAFDSASIHIENRRMDKSVKIYVDKNFTGTITNYGEIEIKYSK